MAESRSLELSESADQEKRDHMESGEEGSEGEHIEDVFQELDDDEYPENIEEEYRKLREREDINIIEEAKTPIWKKKRDWRREEPKEASDRESSRSREDNDKWDNILVNKPYINGACTRVNQ